MHAEMPEWDSGRKGESLLQLGAWFNEQARGMFLQDKTHVHLFVLLGDDGVGAFCPAVPELTKEQLAEAVRETVKEQGSYAVLHVYEGWAYLPKRKGDHTFKQLALGETTVSHLDPSDKTEALLINVESRDGTTRLWLNPIIRQGDDVSLRDTLTFDEPPKGLFSGWFAG